MKLPNLPSLQAFILIYRSRNITRAAAELRLSKAALTKRLSLLEGEVGQLLFRRSTRKLTPTPEGERLYRSAVKLMDSVREFGASVEQEEKMEGRIAVTCVSAMAQKFLTKILLDFQRRHLGIQLDVTVTDSFLDLIEKDIDLAVRIGQMPMTSLHGKKLGENRTILCAAPAYFASRPVPKKVADLKQHELNYLAVHKDLCFLKSNVALKTVAEPPRVTTNDAQIVTQLGLRGQALIVRSLWDVKDHLQAKRLVPVLENDPLQSNGDVWLLASAGRLQTRRVRALFDAIVAESQEFLG